MVFVLYDFITLPSIVWLAPVHVWSGDQSLVAVDTL